jgi:radical SAM protein with 4Fe4S-binding SPASM domain
VSGNLAGVLARTWKENILFSALLELTYRCNLDCVFCYNDLGLRGTPLSTPQYLALLEDLQAMQVMNLTLSGGEPLAHPDFFRIGRRARELGFVVRVKSNGHALAGALARRLQDEVDPYMVEVSLHGATAATHDRQTRLAGSFARLVANIEGMRALGLRVKINSTLTAWNETEAEAMFEIADRLGVPLQFDPEVTPRDDGDRSPLALTASREGVLALFRLEFARGDRAAKKQGVPAVTVGRQADAEMPVASSKHCGAGSSGITVDPFGNVYPCVQWRVPSGSLHQASIREIWTGSAALAKVRAQTEDVKASLASHGPDAAFMNFCPGLAASRSGGDPLAIYEGATLRQELIRQVMSERKTIPLRVVNEPSLSSK